jgi:hypothetical protein
MSWMAAGTFTRLRLGVAWFVFVLIKYLTASHANSSLTRRAGSQNPKTKRKRKQQTKDHGPVHACLDAFHERKGKDDNGFYDTKKKSEIVGFIS